MLRSRLLFSSQKDPPRDALTISHQLLSRGSFFRPGSAAGLWDTLPLGKRVLDKLEAIVTQEMNALDNCQKVDLPCLMDSDPWKKTGRFATAQELFSVKDRKSSQLMLAPTHEEAITMMVTGMHSILPSSLLPLALYQIGRKFRDEKRPRAGLLRAREFVMKDLYTFDDSKANALKTYESVCRAYERIFKNSLKCQVFKAFADSGAIGGNYSHEFHLPSPNGEDVLFFCDQGEFCANVEVFAAQEVKDGDACTSETCSCGSKGKLKRVTTIEIGHCFFLGERYSKPLQARCVPKGETLPQFVQMGCYGLGITRIIAALVEIGNDEHGIVWPVSVAPFAMGIVPSPKASQEQVDVVFDALKKVFGLDVLLDDRSNVGFGFKMKDAKLIGLPLICTVEHGGSLHLFQRVAGGTQDLGVFPHVSALVEKLHELPLK